MIESPFRSIEQELCTNRTGRDSRIISFTTSIDRIEVSTDWKSWNLNFHKENSRTRISTLFILQMNTLQSYIIITTYLCIYLYIQQKLISPTQQDLMLQKYISKSTRLKIEYTKKYCSQHNANPICNCRTCKKDVKSTNPNMRGSNIFG